MSSVDMQIEVYSINSIEYKSFGRVLAIDVEGLELGDIFDSAGITEVTDYFGTDNLLAEIGREKAIEYFEIKESEE